jgi:hypothetical protein
VLAEHFCEIITKMSNPEPKQVRFTLRSVASPTDKKTTVVMVTAIQVVGEDVAYLFPEEYQHISKHLFIQDLGPIKSAKGVLKKRNKRLHPKVTLMSDAVTAYFDKDGNPTFEGEILEDFDPRYETDYIPCDDEDNASESASNITAAHQKSTVSELHTCQPAPKPLATITKDMIIEKYTGSNGNVQNWLRVFEYECNRINVPTDRYHEALGLFVDGEAKDWFTAMRMIIASRDWKEWKTRFLDAFANKGWSDIIYGLEYCYIAGSLSAYAFKKLSLITDMEPGSSDRMKIYLIVAGLPVWARSRIDRSETDSIETLFKKINQFENPSKSNSRKNSKSHEKRSRKTATEPCAYCLKKGFRRIHLESECRNKKWDEEYKNKGQGPNNNRPFKINTAELTSLVEEQKN